MDKTLLWVWLALHLKPGTHVYQYLLEEFENVENIYECVDSDVNNLPWLYDNQKKKILDKNLDRAKEVIRWCEKSGVKILTLDDEEYPENLKTIKDKPGVLYYIGTLPDFKKELCIGVVGTREMTVYGEESAFEIGYGLTKGGATVISGGANGIDSTAQKGAITAGGKTVSILGSGIDVLYPYENKEFFLKVAENGAVITEYPPHTPPNRYNFPVRNRLISGMSNGLVVVEADRNSGAIITADKAKSQGRPVFSVPGPIRSFQSTGTNMLIRNGAKSVTSALDILEEYLDEYADKIQITPSKEKPDLVLLHSFSNHDEGGTLRNYLEAIGYKIKLKLKKTKKTGKKAETNSDLQDNTVNLDKLNLDNNTKSIYDFMENDKRYNIDSFDELGLSVSVIVTSLSLLEMNKVVKSLPGGFYEKN